MSVLFAISFFPLLPWSCSLIDSTWTGHNSVPAVARLLDFLQPSPKKTLRKDHSAKITSLTDLPILGCSKDCGYI